MLTFLRRPLYILSNKIRRQHYPGKAIKKKWTADFSKPEKIPFDIKPENCYDAYPDRGALGFGLKKTNYMAWVEAPEYYFQDQIIEARFRLDSLGAYAAAGLMFRIHNEGTYYLALVSSKGYFRVDVVRESAPLPLIGWTEAPLGSPGGARPDSADAGPLAVKLTIIAWGEHLTFFINDSWVAEIDEQSIAGGHIGFALTAYESGNAGGAEENAPAVPEGAEHTCRAWLDFLSVEPRGKNVEEYHRQWIDSADISADSRLRLAETFAALNAAAPALVQIKKAWERREAAARSVTATYTEMRTRRELLLAARLAVGLERYDEAEEFLNACLEQGPDTTEGEAALAEKTRLLVKLKKFPELRDCVLEHIGRGKHDPALYALLGHAHWNMEAYEPAAAAWDKAFELDRENGLYAVNAANAYERLDKKDEALRCRLEGGRLFLRQGNDDELGVLIPRLLSLDEGSWEARALAGKWAFGAGNFNRAETELALAESIRRKLKPPPPADSAVSYLRGLLLVHGNKHREALRFLEEAARLSPDYGLFRFKLAEIRYLVSGSASARGIDADLQAALELMPDDGWVHNFAARVCLARNNPEGGDLEAAERHLEKAAGILGEIPAVKANRGVLCCLRGSLARALQILDVDGADDPEGLMTSQAGDLLFHSGDFVNAAAFYRRARDAAPENFGYLSGHAACLMELGRFAETEELLLQAYNRSPAPEILQLIHRMRARRQTARRRAAPKKTAVSSSETSDIDDAAKKPQADATREEPRAITTNPGVATKKSHAATSKPGAVMEKPRAVTSKPGVTTEELRAVTSKLGVVTKKSHAATSKSGVATEKPHADEDKFGVTTEELRAVARNSGAVMEKPRVTASKLSAATEEPDAPISKSSVVTKKSRAATSKPEVVTKKTRAAVSKSDTAAKKPRAPTSKSGAVTKKPRAAASKSDTAAKKPRAPTSKSGAVTKKPRAAASKSDTAAKKPRAPTSKSGAVTKKPRVAAGKSDAAAKKSRAPTSKSGAVAKKTRVAAGKSSTVAGKSRAATSKSGIATKKTRAAASKSDTAAKKSRAPTSKSGAVTKKPRAPTSKSGIATKKPRYATSKSGAVTKKPRAPAGKPGAVTKKSRVAAGKSGVAAVSAKKTSGKKRAPHKQGITTGGRKNHRY